MKLADEAMEDIRVVPDPESAGVELQIGPTPAHDPLAVHLTPEEARNLAALLLFQTNRQDMLYLEQESRRRS